LNDLVKRKLWNEDMKDQIIRHKGSVQEIDDIPADLKELYKTVWEISQKTIINMAADRGIYIDQSQSLNLFIQNPNYAKLTAMHFYAWEKGLKTGMYYLRSKAAADAIQFTIKKEEAAAKPMDVTTAENVAYEKEILTAQAQLTCSLENPEDCEVCGS